MLNRLYIVIGSLLILLIAFAFVGPYFIDWSDRRAQIETLASEALGTPVHIAGDIDIHVLPQPRVTIDGISIGPEGDTIAVVDHAEAILSLTDFLRDRYNVTSLEVSGAEIQLSVDEDGAVKAPINLPETVNASNVSIANATLTDGALTVTDTRSGGKWRLADLDGSLALSALRGPFGLNATGNFEGAPYQVRINTSQMNAEGDFQVALYLRAVEAGVVLNAEGMFSSGTVPSFAGEVSLRQPPPADAEAVRGNLVLNAQVDANTKRARLTNYVLVPDENRAGTRMTGAAEIEFGAQPAFQAVVSGGVVALAPRDARKETDADPYEFMRLISELPAPLVPPMPGEINIDINELDLRAFALRDVRLDATTDGTDWQIAAFEGKLPGDSDVGLTGTIGVRDGRPWGEGRLTIDTDRLDALVQLWRPPDENVPLFGIEASLDTQFTLANDAVRLTDGSGSFDGASYTFSGRLPAPGGRLDLTAALGNFDNRQSRALMASLPGILGDPGFAASFASGSFDVSAEALDVFGLAGSKLSARGDWSGDELNFSQIAAGEWGGASFTLSGGYEAGEQPIVTGSGRIILEQGARDGALPVAYDQFGIAPEVRAFISRNLPASLDLVVAPPDEDGVQSVDVGGRVGNVDLTLAANLTRGLPAYLESPLGVRATLESHSPHDLMAALGFDLPLDNAGGATATVKIEGTPTNSVDTQFTYVSPADKLQFTGNVIPTDLSDLKGRGRFEFDLAAPSAWAEPLGLTGLYLPAVKGVSEIAFSGPESITISALNADAGGTSVRGDIVRAIEAGTPLYTGSLALGGVDIAGFATLFAGSAALMDLGDAVWPDGPLAEADGPRATRGRISVTANAVVSDDHALAGATSFDVMWDDRNTRLRGLRATVGGGTLNLDLGVCCTGTPGPRQVTGRLGLTNVALDALVPEAPAAALDARMSGAMQMSGAGETLDAIIASLTGQGSFSATDIAIAGFDPGAFETIADTESLIDMDADELTALVADALASGPFLAERMDGVLSLAGGTLRADNLSATNEDGKLYGGIAFSLADLGIDGSWTLSPIGGIGDNGLINESTGRIGVVLDGTLLKPQHELDLAQMVDTIQVRAYELEVDRLERVRAEQDARARAAAEERARLMALEAKRQAEEAAAQAEAEARARAEEAARQAAEAEAARLAAQKAAEEEAAAAAQEAAERRAAEEEAAAVQRAAEEEAAAEAAAAAAAQRAAEEDAQSAAEAPGDPASTEAVDMNQGATEQDAADPPATQAPADTGSVTETQPDDPPSIQTIEEQNLQTIEDLLQDLGESQDPLVRPNAPAADEPVNLLQ